MKKVLLINDFGSYYSPFEHIGEYINDPKILDRSPENVVLVVFTGGHDVTPSIYGETAHRLTNNSPKRDVQEIEIFKKARNHNIPMFGICRGSQFLCVMAGGKLHQHVNNHGGTQHSIKTVDGRLIDVNSTHHQMQIPPKDAQLLAWASPSLHFDEDYREAECVDYPSINAVGVQYHPEWLDKDSEAFLYCKELVDNLLQKQISGL